MKALYLFILTFLSLGCSKSSNNNAEYLSELTSSNEQNEQDKVKSEFDFSSMMKEFELKNQQEKIQLLSIIYDEPIDTIKSIIGTYLEYSMSKEYLLSISKNDSNVENPIVKTVNSYTLTPKKTASIIFSHQYEMITR